MYTVEYIKQLDNLDYESILNKFLKIALLYEIKDVTEKKFDWMRMDQQITYVVKCIQWKFKKIKKQFTKEQWKFFEEQFIDTMFVMFIKGIVENLREKHPDATDADIVLLIEEKYGDNNKYENKSLWRKKKN